MRTVKALTLLEVMIATVLSAVIMGALFMYFKQSALLNIKIQVAKQETLRRKNIHEHLMKIVSSIAPSEEVALPIYTKDLEGISGSVCVFSFDNGVDFDPRFNGVLQAALYLNSNHELVLSFYNQEDQERHLILYENLGYFRPSFFDMEKKKWFEHWPLSKTGVPGIVQFSIAEKKGDEIDFSFPVPVEQCEIPYPIKKSLS